jgi:spermidine/putrescine transport system ATP-binding protein
MRSVPEELVATAGTESVPAVRLEHVTKKFGDFTAVDDISLEVGENRFFALLGPSGCGKTTTLRIIGGFEEPTAGVVYLHGEDVTGLKPYRRPVNTVFQSYALFPHLTVWENVAFGLRRRHFDDAEIRRRVAEMLELVQLTGRENQKPRQLSGGQQQRVALARALINHPRVLLLDEPLGALDLKLRKEMQIELKRIQQEVGITFIHVTHDQEEAMTMADTIAVMNHGRIERLGSPTEIYEDPKTEFTASFLGASNLMEVQVVDGSSGRVALPGGDELQVPAGRLPKGERKAKVGVRPEKIRLVEPGSEVQGNVVTGRVVDASFIGVSTHYLVKTALGQEMAVTVQNLEDHRFRPGDDVLCVWNPEHTFVVR